MTEISVINFIEVPSGMEKETEEIRDVYASYFKQQPGFLSSTFYRSFSTPDGSPTRYVNIVVWDSYESFEKIVNRGFNNSDGENLDGMRVLGKGFPEPIVVSPGQYIVLAQDHC